MLTNEEISEMVKHAFPEEIQEEVDPDSSFGCGFANGVESVLLALNASSNLTEDAVEEAIITAQDAYANNIS